MLLKHATPPAFPGQVRHVLQPGQWLLRTDACRQSWAFSCAPLRTEDLTSAASHDTPAAVRGVRWLAFFSDAEEADDPPFHFFDMRHRVVEPDAPPRRPTKPIRG